MKIVVLDGFTLNPGDLSWAGFEKLGQVTVYERTPAELIRHRIGDADVILTNKTPLTRETLISCPNLKYIGVLATGFNVVDISAAAQYGMTVTNIPTYGTSSVAQFTFALLLELCHHAGAHADSVRAGDWTASKDFCYWHYPLIELAGKTMGIIGFGRIGQATARIAAAFGMSVLAYDEYQNPAAETDVIRYAELDHLLATADVISLHCPLTDKTRGMISRENLSIMKNGVLIINTSRGPLINETDLAEALSTGKVAAAGVDVVTTEPILIDNPLLQAKNCLITPHIAWAPKESRARLMAIAVDNLQHYIDGTVINKVN